MSGYKIVDWGKCYENNRTREMRRMSWVPMPNRHDGDGYTQLLDHPNGAAHFGAWCALVQVASKCDERGTLMRSGGIGHDPESLERITRIPVKVWSEVLPRLLQIGWLQDLGLPQEPAECPPTESQAPAEKCPSRERKERKEQNGSAAGSRPEENAFYHRIEKGFLDKNGDRFTDYPKEGKSIHGLIAKARARDAPNAEGLLASVCTQFWRLKQGTDKFWRGQPFLPSALNCAAIWDRVLESMRTEEIDPDILAIVRREKS